MAARGQTGSSGDNFIKLLAGALVGAALGYLLGKAVVFGVGTTRVPFMDMVGAALGCVLGFTVVRLFTGGKKEAAPAADAKAEKGKAEKKK
jgi:F0F1-type ATP synthase assembly protein I